MLQNGHAVTQETFHYLLMGCLKDKETGFRLALQVDMCGISVREKVTPRFLAVTLLKSGEKSDVWKF